MRDDERRGHDLEPGHTRHRRPLQPFADQIPQALVFQSAPDAAEHLHDITAGAAARIQHPDIRVRESLVAAELGAQDTIDAFDHIRNDLSRRVPDAERATQFRVEVLQKGLVKILNRLRIVERCEKGRPVDAA